jgi:hypothetical protein
MESELIVHFYDGLQDSAATHCSVQALSVYFSKGSNFSSASAVNVMMGGLLLYFV